MDLSRYGLYSSSKATERIVFIIHKNKANTRHLYMSGYTMLACMEREIFTYVFEQAELALTLQMVGVAVHSLISEERRTHMHTHVVRMNQ